MAIAPAEGPVVSPCRADHPRVTHLFATRVPPPKSEGLSVRVILGLVSAPIVATYLYDIVLRQKSNISNIIANTFSPLFLITVICYLIAMFYAKKSPYSDRDFLITFNGLLIAVWAITVFSISGIGNFKKIN